MKTVYFKNKVGGEAVVPTSKMHFIGVIAFSFVALGYIIYKLSPVNFSSGAEVRFSCVTKAVVSEQEPL